MSPDSNGGFASVRAVVSAPPTGIVAAIALVLCGGGHRYKLNLRTDRGFDGVNYQAAFAPPGGQWVTLHLPLDALKHPGWPGLGNYKVLASIVVLSVFGLYLVFR